MQTVRFGVIGLGNMGAYHCNYLNTLEGGKLAAICDVDPAKADAMAKKFEVPKFSKYQDLLASNTCDAVIVATPHYDHSDQVIAAFEKGLHVITEKPQAVTINEARRMNEAAARHPHLKFAIDFQSRTSPAFRKLRELLQSGELGEITRITWIATAWFRPWSYYASGGWRATWAGEGGGLLINQCPHNLDQLYWLTNMMPSRMTAVGFIGKTHPIEVEDEISAIMEYSNGAIGHFITTTGEAPGADRLEIATDRGRIVSENGKLSLKLTRKSVRQIRETIPDLFPSVEAWDVDIPIKGTGGDAKFITQNFVNAIVKDEPLISPGQEGIKGLELGNAMMMSGLTRKAVDLPLDGDAYDAFIKEMTEKYGGKKKLATKTSDATPNMAASFRAST